MEKSLSSRRKYSGLALSAAVLAGLMSFGTAPAGATTPAAGNDAGAAAVQSLLQGERHSQFIVQYKAGAQGATANARAKAWGNAAKKLGITPREVRSLATGATLVSTSKALDAQQSKTFMAELAASGAVEYVEPDVRMRATLTPNDPRYGEQWDFTGTNGMRIPGAWNSSTGTGSVVAVIDTGITAHPDLDANILPGYDFISSSADARDGNGRDSNPQDQGDWYTSGECGDSSSSNSSWHGTHVAGTVAAVTGNATGVAGVAPDAKVVPVRVLGKCGGMLSDIADAIIWSSGGTVSGIPANANPADVINMSLGGGGTCASTYQNAINSAVSRGTAVVVAAGNEGTNASSSQPANCSNVVTVAASNNSGGLSYYSNYGSVVDITAPGGDTRQSGGGILSTLNSGTTTPASASYAWYQGTSMATPHVAGLVALMKTANPALTPAQVESTLKQGTRPMPAGCSLGCGAGLSDATATLALLGGGGTTPPPATGNVLLNPGFESGSASWTSNKTDTFETGSSARTGTGFAALNGWGQSSSYTLDQKVTVPTGTGAGTLSFFLRILSDEGTTTAYDTLKVQVIDGSTTTTLATYSNKEKGSSYVQRTVDLSAYKGKTVTLRFLGAEDYSYATTFQIDDTSVTVS
ncbi:peptidase S8 [Arthrobacter sp. SW1]|uniref:S8 family serine peptidase n=1 Tax=Arthrobacter sp. SW1 TaxID=1920889 RepID=UPI000877C86E|nr:S8 family serine peptidase [Arthrobacter sp. SW1]OFI39987.1 peptidase S8 [Arthrobacter sp. SW1]